MKMRINIIDKIDLDGISNNFWYATMAYFVDKDEFIEAIKEARVSIGLTLPIDYEDAEKWLSQKYKTESLRNFDEADKIRFNQKIRLNTAVDKIKEKFHKGVNYTDSIKYAILAGKITDKEYIPSAFCSIYPFSKEFEEIELFNEQPMVAIFVNPDTKMEEVKILMDTQVKELFRGIKKDVKSPRKSQNIRRDRGWYWLKRFGGKSYQEIAGLCKNETLDDRDIVIKAIKQYEKHLSAEK